MSQLPVSNDAAPTVSMTIQYIYTHTYTLMHTHTYMCVQLYGARNMAWHLWANFALSSCVCECVSGY